MHCADFNVESMQAQIYCGEYEVMQSTVNVAKCEQQTIMRENDKKFGNLSETKTDLSHLHAHHIFAHGVNTPGKNRPSTRSLLYNYWVNQTGF